MFSSKKSIEEQDTWLNDYFSCHKAGAEFLLPWLVDTYFITVNRLKTMFTADELKTIIEAHKGMVIDTVHLKLPHLMLQISEKYESQNFFLKYGVTLQNLENKFRQLDNTQTAVLILWAASFWHGKNTSAESMDKYISPV